MWILKVQTFGKRRLQVGINRARDPAWVTQEIPPTIILLMSSSGLFSTFLSWLLECLYYSVLYCTVLYCTVLYWCLSCLWECNCDNGDIYIAGRQPWSLIQLQWGYYINSIELNMYLQKNIWIMATIAENAVIIDRRGYQTLYFFLK